MKLDDKYEYLKMYLKYSKEIETLEQLDVDYSVVCRIQCLKSNRSKICESIYNVKNSTERNMLLQRFVLGRSNERIAERSAYSVRQVQRLIHQGVKNLETLSLPYENL